VFSSTSTSGRPIILGVGSSYIDPTRTPFLLAENLPLKVPATKFTAPELRPSDSPLDNLTPMADVYSLGKTFELILGLQKSEQVAKEFNPLRALRTIIGGNITKPYHACVLPPEDLELLRELVELMTMEAPERRIPLGVPLAKQEAGIDATERSPSVLVVLHHLQHGRFDECRAMLQDAKLGR
jgi:hypothetical protein